MAETYLTSLLRPLSQRRNRALGSIDPMESAAAMDRMQGAVVSGTAQMEPAGAESNILQLAGGKGGRVPVRTAQMTEDDEAPAQQTGFPMRAQPKSRCANGMCGPPGIATPYSLTRSAPIVTTTTMPSAPVSSAPVQSTTVSTPTNLGQQAIGLAGNYATAPQAGAALTVYGYDTAAGVEHSKTDLSREKFRREQANYDREYPTREQAALAAIASTNADTALTLAEAGNSRAMADIAAGSSVPGMLSQRAAALHGVITGDTSVDDYAVAMARADQTSPIMAQADGKTKVAKLENLESPFTLDARVEQYRRAGYAALALNGLFRAEQVAVANREKQYDAPFDMTRAALNFKRTPMAPLPDTIASSQPIDPVEVASAAADTLVRNYRRQAFDLSRDEFQLRMEDDVLRPLRNVNIARHTAGIDQKADPEKWNQAEAKGVAEAERYYRFLSMKVLKAYDDHNSPDAAKSQKPKMTWQQYQGIEDTVDSNDTLPALPPRGDL